MLEFINQHPYVSGLVGLIFGYIVADVVGYFILDKGHIARWRGTEKQYWERD